MAGKKKEADDGEQPCINLDVVHEAAFVGNFISPPSAFIEDNGKPERATLDDFRLISKRLKRIRIVYLMFFRTVDCIFTWMYPKISAISMMIYTLLGIFLPSQLAFPLIILIVTVFCITMSPSCANFRKSLEKNFFSEKNRIKSFPQICTIKESEFKIKKEFANFKEKDKDGVLNTIKKIRIDLDELVIILLDIVSFTEKMRNLFLWEDPQKSLYFCCGLTILIYLLYSIPFRLLLLVIGLLKFLTGRKKTLKMLKNNCQLCQEVLDSLFSKYLPDFFLKVTQEKPWSQELINNITLQKKFVEKIRAQLDLDIDITIFQRYSSPKLLHEALSSCETTLKLRDRDGHIAEKSNKQSQNFLAGFLSNIPSEYYRFQHPRLTNLYAAN